MEIVRPAHTEYHEELNLEYRFRNDPEAGFAFPWKDGKEFLIICPKRISCGA